MHIYIITLTSRHVDTAARGRIAGKTDFPFYDTSPGLKDNASPRNSSVRDMPL